MKPRHFKFIFLMAALFRLAEASGQTVSGEAKLTDLSERISTCVNVNLQQEIKVAVQPLVALAVTESLESLASLRTLEGIGQHFSQPDITIDGNAVQMPGTFAAEKTKNIARSFKVSAADKLSIVNQHGRVDVQTWNRNEIAVEVRIISRAASEAKAQEILDNINIHVAESNNLISFVTVRKPMEIRNSTHKSFEINYLVKMPKGNPLLIDNKYGSVQLPDFDGPTDVTVKYGKLAAGRLNNRSNIITIAYSGGECLLEYMKGGELGIKYSSLKLNEADEITATTAYSNITIDKANVLTVESRYDNRFQLGSIGQISGSGSYSSIKIGSLKESASMNVKYCAGFEISGISSNFKKLDLNGGYTGMVLNFADKPAFNFEINTQYGNLKMDQDLADFTYKEVKNTSSYYKGKYGKASPKGSVNVVSRYGSVHFN